MPPVQVIAHGIDLVEIARIEAMLHDHGPQFTGRCFTEKEQAYADAAPRMRAQRYAARFACKEAVLKALGIETEIVIDESEYDHPFIVRLDELGRASLTHLHF